MVATHKPFLFGESPGFIWQRSSGRPYWIMIFFSDILWSTAADELFKLYIESFSFYPRRKACTQELPHSKNTCVSCQVTLTVALVTTRNHYFGACLKTLHPRMS